MNPATCFVAACLLMSAQGQRSGYAPRPVGTLQVLDQYTPAPAAGESVPNRIGGADENYAGPLQPAPGTMGDPYLTPHLPQWPREHQPFWYLNQQHIMNHRGQAQPATQGVQGQQGQTNVEGGVDQQGVIGQQNFQGGQAFPETAQGRFQGAQRGQGFQGSQSGQAFPGTQRGQGFQGAQRGQGFQGTQRGQGFQGTQRGQGFQGSGINSRLGDDEAVVLGSQQHRTPLVRNRVDRPELGTQFRGPQ